MGRPVGQMPRGVCSGGGWGCYPLAWVVTLWWLLWWCGEGFSLTLTSLTSFGVKLVSQVKRQERQGRQERQEGKQEGKQESL